MTTEPLNLLIVEDNAAHVEAIQRAFDQAGVRADIHSVGTLREYRDYIAAHSPDFALVDLNLPDGHATEVLVHSPKDAPCPILVMTAFGNEQIVTEVMKAGALDYVVKSPEAFAAMPQTVERALREWDLLRKQKRAEEAIRESTEEFRAMFEVASIGMAQADVQTGQWLRVNHKMCAITGYSADEMLKMRVPDVTHPEDRQKDWESFQQVVRGEAPDYRSEKRYVHKDGSVCWVNVNMTVTRDAGGHAIQTMATIEDITERKRKEENLRRLATVVRDSNDAITIQGFEGEITAWNRGAEQMYGYSEKEALLMNIDLLTASGKVVEQKEFIRRLLAGEAITSFETQRVTKDGRILDVWMTVSKLMDGTGNSIGLASTERDITEHKQAAEALGESQRLIEGILNTIPVRVFWKNLNLNYMGCNLVFAHDAGFADPKDIIGKDDYQMGWRDQAELYRGGDRQVIESGCPRYLIEEPQTTPEGKTLTALSSKLPLRNSNGEICGVLGTYMDITERKKAEEHLKLISSALQVAANAIVITDGNGVIEWVNNAFTTLTGYGVLEAVDKKTSLLRSGKHDEEFYRNLWATVSAGKVWQGEMINRRKDGALYTEEMTITPIMDSQGGIAHFIAIKQDITARRLLEAQFLRAQRMESVGTLAGGIAHDLNNVLGPILMIAEALKSQVTDVQGRKWLRVLEDSAQHGADLVRQVLAFARGVEGKRILLNPVHILNELQDMIRDTFPKNIDSSYDPRRGVWTVAGDPTQLHQVFTNLCVNARDAMPNGGALKVTIENVVLDQLYADMNPEAKPGDYVMVTVADSGSGIPADIRDKIFEPFFTTKEISKGTGLGLSTTMGILKSHGGFIRVCSEMGKGTTFKAYLPATTTSNGAENVAVVENPLPRGNGELVLVVDDEERMRTVVQGTLEQFGYRVLLAVNGAEAVALYAQKREQIAIVLTDMAMPVMDGPATIVALKSMNPNLKIIGSSGLPSDGDVAKAAGVGVKHFVPKPYTAETLLKILAEALRE
jgi:PAS domain S-box-containing protein